MDRGGRFHYNENNEWRWLMSIQKKKDFLITCAYWAVIVGAGYLAFEYLVPI